MTATRTPLAAALAATLLAAGCSAGSGTSGGSSSTPRAGAVGPSVALGLVAEPASLDFTRSDGAAIPQVELGNIYETLVKVDQSGQVVPALARSWTVSPDRRTYTFELRPGVTFTDGRPLTADDVVYSVQQVKTAWTTGLKTKMDPVERVTAASPTRVVVQLTKPSNGWLYDMTTRVGAIFGRSSSGALATKPVGTGPYTFTRWNRGDSVVLTRNDRYWGTKPYFGQVTLKYFKDPTALNNALASDQIDVVTAVQAPDTLAQVDRSRFQVVEGLTNGEVVLSMNSRRAPFDDVRVRRAVRQAIDHRALVRTCWAGKGTPIGSMVPPTDPWYEDLTGVAPHDPGEARRLLTEAGRIGTTVRLRLPSLPYATACGPVVKSMLEQAGLKVSVDTLEFPAAWLASVFKGADYDLSIVAHTEPRDLGAVFDTPGYYTGYRSPQLHAFLQQADSGDPAQQVASMKQAARLVSDEAAADFLFLLPNLMVADKDITGLPKNSITEGLDLAGLARS